MVKHQKKNKYEKNIFFVHSIKMLNLLKSELRLIAKKKKY